jgi:hypothetical protein
MDNRLRSRRVKSTTSRTIDHQNDIPITDSKSHVDTHLHNRHWLIVFGVLIATIQLVAHYHNRLPAPEHPSPTNDRFSEHRALPLLTRLSNFGPKPSGSDACDRLTAGAIVDELR